MYLWYPDCGERRLSERKEKNFKIVIVEDDPDTAEMLERMLRIKGYDVFKVFRASEALTHISDQKPDAVLLDVMMPDFSGLDVLREIRKEYFLNDVPVIIISARTLPTDIQQGLAAGAEYYLTKPVSFHDLNNALSEVLGRRAMGA